jgi:hypothetical protein
MLEQVWERMRGDLILNDEGWMILTTTRKEEIDEGEEQTMATPEIQADTTNSEKEKDDRDGLRTLLAEHKEPERRRRTTAQRFRFRM